MTTVMLPVDIGDVPVVMQALRDRMATIAATRSLDDGRTAQLREHHRILRQVVERSEKQIERMAGRMLADAEQVPV